MRKTKERPKFYAFYKDFNDGKIKAIEVLEGIFYEIFTEKGAISKKHFCTYDRKTYKSIPITTKEHLKEFVVRNLVYRFWSKCEWEMIVVDFPYREHVDDSRPLKVDVYDQLKPNIDLIVDLVWNYIEPKIKK